MNHNDLLTKDFTYRSINAIILGLPDDDIDHTKGFLVHALAMRSMAMTGAYPEDSPYEPPMLTLANPAGRADCAPEASVPVVESSDARAKVVIVHKNRETTETTITEALKLLDDQGRMPDHISELVAIPVEPRRA